MVERDQVLVFVNDDFDVSEGEDSDFEEDGVYSYRSDAFGAISNIEELNSSPLPAIASGDEEPLSSDSEWLPSLQQGTTTGKSICQVEYRKVNVCSYVEHSPLNFIFAIAYEFLKTCRSILKKKSPVKGLSYMRVMGSGKHTLHPHIKIRGRAYLSTGSWFYSL